MQRCKLAVEFAPALPEAHTCLARALLAENPAAISPALAQLVAAAEAAARDPRISRAMLANALGVLFAGLLLGGLAFVALLFARHARLYAHDVHHLFPGRPRRWQTGMLAAVLLLVPLLLQMGPVPLLFTALLACALYLAPRSWWSRSRCSEPWLQRPLPPRAIGRVASFGGAGRGRVDGRARRRHRPRDRAPAAAAPTGRGDLAVFFALAHKAKRDGDLGAAEKLYLRALEAQGDAPSARLRCATTWGTSIVLQGETAKAVAQYRQAVDLNEGLAAPHFNLARALAMGGVEASGKGAGGAGARASSWTAPRWRPSPADQLQANRKSNKFVMDVPLDDAELAPLREVEARAAARVGDEVRASLAAGMPSGLAAVLPLFAAALLLGLHFGRAAPAAERPVRPLRPRGVQALRSRRRVPPRRSAPSA